MIVFLFVLFSVGAVSAIYLSSRPQDIRQQASYNGGPGTKKEVVKLPPPAGTYNCSSSQGTLAMGQGVCEVNVTTATIALCPDANDAYWVGPQLSSTKPAKKMFCVDLNVKDVFGNYGPGFDCSGKLGVKTSPYSNLLKRTGSFNCYYL